MKIGTAHFENTLAAQLYYKKNHNENLRAVEKKIEQGAILIGKPPVSQNESLSLVEGRYFIQTNS